MDWKNWARNIAGNVADKPPLASRGDVEAALGAAVAAGSRVQIAAGAYSTSQLLKPHNSPVLLDVRGVMLPDGRAVQYPARHDPGVAVAPADHVWVAAGASIQQVLDRLANANPRRTLAMVGAFSGQTFVGAMSTATHGSGFGYGTLADLVVAIELVTVVDDGNGGSTVKRLLIASDDGVVVDVPGNRNLFDAAVVSLGSIGVITAVLVRVSPMRRLAKKVEYHPWPEVRALLRGPAAANGIPAAFATMPTGEPVDSAGILVCPYPVDGFDAPAVMSRSYVADQAPPGAEAPSAPPCSLLAQFGNWWTSTIPPDELKRALWRQLVSLRDPPLQHGDAPQMLTSPAAFGGIIGYGIEYSFRVDASGDYIRAIDAMLDEMNRLGSTPPKQIVVGFTSIRFQGASRGLLAHRDGPTCTVEVLSSTNGQGRTVLSAIEDVALDHGGRPHWGQVFGMGNDVTTTDPARLARIADDAKTELRLFYGRVRAAGIRTQMFENAAHQVLLHV